MLDFIGRLFDSGESDFQEELSQSPSPREIERFTKLAAAHYANSRVLRLRSKLVWFTSGCVACLAVFLGMLTIENLRIGIVESIYPAEHRLRNINAFLRQDTSANESAEHVKKTLREILLDRQFQKEMVIDNISQGEHHSIGFSNFPSMAKSDIWNALGSGGREDFELAFKDDFIDYLRQEYSVAIQDAFQRTKRINRDEVRRLLSKLGQSKEDASPRIMSKSAERSQCGERIDHNALQVEIALPRDVWLKWKAGEAFVYLQCSNQYVPRIELLLEGKYGSADLVQLVGVVPAESEPDYNMRVASQSESEFLTIQQIRDAVPIEARLTAATANALGIAEDQNFYNSVITFRVSANWTRE